MRTRRTSPADNRTTPSRSDGGQARDDASQALLELRAIFDNAAVAILFSRGRWIQRCNQRAAALFGYDAPEALAGQPAAWIHKSAETYEELISTAAPLFAAGEPFHSDWEFRQADGTALVCNVYGQAVDPAHIDEGAVWVIEDVTDARRNEQLLRERQAILDTTMEYMDQGISIVDADLRMLAANRRFQELLEFPDWLCQPGTPFSEFIRYNAERGDYGPGDVDEQVRARVELAGRFEPHEFQRERPDGTVLEIRGRPVPGGGFVTVYTDVTKRARAEERAQYLATHDSLTGLPNRDLFNELLTHTLTSARRYGRAFAVLFIDLDRFKIINDTLGHEAGDALVREMAERFTACVRDSDVIARLGGDEFIVLIEEVDDERQAAATARKLNAAALEPVTIMGRECRVTASVGISLFPDDAQDGPSLMRNADIAMYQAKEDGKNAYQFYSRVTRSRASDPMAMEADLRRAIERDELSLTYQAKLGLATDTIVGVEALVRWQHPEQGTLQPAQFIPIAEETGLILGIGKWVLRQACAQHVAWTAAGLPPVSVAVNLSPRQFRDDNLLDDLDAILRETGMDPAYLELEVTESVVMFNVEEAVDKLHAIKRRGVRLAIDDFGTGFSSLSHIKHFPVDTLKVDRSFIRDLAVDADDRAITRAIIAMGATLGLGVVAEGVETREQYDFLRDYACDQIQGYYFSKPVAEPDFGALLRGHRPWSKPGDSA
ncbi:EAL domain-containing protein [Aquisalimonas lutea]|uniref:putative bifunctional diguanylate cyclase/phosphodiesterase n=1 Tax=Aquisalimonas lutea TaxID=1327750 RepID=UPI0025B30B3E|nr:EAL domain-containing protein [Aquisalimonas lutea]MDN3517295.1 EAL domain-containing protein [Aquisalimonas lutea]